MPPIRFNRIQMSEIYSSKTPTSKKKTNFNSDRIIYQSEVPPMVAKRSETKQIKPCWSQHSADRK